MSTKFYWAVKGYSPTKGWVILFAPYYDRRIAERKCAELAEANPQIKYRAFEEEYPGCPSVT